MIKDLQIPTSVYLGEIVRDSNGLAISSRNKYLDQSELVVASQIFESLSEIKEFFVGTACCDEKELINFLSEQCKKIESKGFKVEYLEIRDSLSLDSCDSLKANQEYILLVAAKLNNVRLIDNIEFTL
jgi:pantoate--beta-alanine ligase